MAFVDKVLKCRDCGEEFVFTAGEQAFFAEKGFTNEPTRCRPCRTARKRERGFDGQPGRDLGYREMGPRPAAGPRRMYKVICSSCGVETEVPFQPRAGRPVYCRDCFSLQRAN